MRVRNYIPTKLFRKQTLTLSFSRLRKCFEKKTCFEVDPYPVLGHTKLNFPYELSCPSLYTLFLSILQQFFFCYNSFGCVDGNVWKENFIRKSNKYNGSCTNFKLGVLKKRYNVGVQIERVLFKMAD